MRKLCSLLVCVLLFVTCPFSSLAISRDPFTDAFSMQYNMMADEEAYAKLNAVPLAPGGGGVLPQLAGKTYNITDGNGMAFGITFGARGAGVSVSAQLPLPPFVEGDPTQVAFESEYAGLAAGDFVLVGFREPETAKAWSIILNLKNGLAAVYEVFFAESPGWGAPTPAREAQRNVYLGKADGIGTPMRLPSATNRLTGKAVLWENDLGSFFTNYGTRSWSAFYPLGQPEGMAGSWTAPSDYFDFHDARHFVYSRTESVYSGATLIELLDLHLVSQIGLKIGFDADDTLEFQLYKGKGKILGSYAAYGGFAAAEYPDGMFGRFAYRPNSEKLTKEEVTQAIEEEGSWKGAFGGPGKDEKMYPLTDKLNGKSFSLAFDDGLTLEYEFAGINDMKFREKGAPDWISGRYEAFEVDANLIFFTHAINDDFPDKIYLNVVDFDNGLATCMNSEILVDEVSPRMCIPSFHFGVLNMAGIKPVSQRHGFSEGLLGTSFTWTYNDSMVSQHYYATPDSLYYAIMGQDGEAFLMWSCDAWYVKFRENVYLISWMESFGPGQNDSKIFNLNTMHDAGVCYGIPDGAPFEYNTYGSEARHAGTVDVSDIYDKDEQVTVPDTGGNTGGSSSGGSGKGDGSGSSGGGVVGGGSNGGGSNGGGANVAPGTQVIEPQEVALSDWTLPGVTPRERDFTDVPQTNWAHAYIDRLAAYGIVDGYLEADGTYTYRPEGLITRAEIIKLIVASRSLPLEENFDGSAFADWPSVEDWAKPYVGAAVKAGIVNGSLENDALYIYGGRNISRQEMIAMAVRALGIEVPAGAAAPAGITDFNDTGAWARDAAAFAASNGMINTNGSVLRPQADAARAEAAMALYKLLERLNA